MPPGGSSESHSSALVAGHVAAAVSLALGWVLQVHFHQLSSCQSCEVVLGPICQLRKQVPRGWVACPGLSKTGSEPLVSRESLSSKITLRQAVRAEQTLGLDILFLPQPLLFELVVTPGALARVCQEPATGNSLLPTDTLAESSGAPRGCVLCSPPAPQAQQGPGEPLLHANVARAKGETGRGASFPHTDQGSPIRAQSREEAAA